MIKIENLCCIYYKDQYSRKKALDALSLTINKGEVVALIGENGAGKTTLLKAVMGLLPITVGQITVAGKNPQEMLGEMAFITEEISSFGHETPQNFAEFLSVLYPNFNMQRFELLVQFFNLEDKKISHMSKGQQTKVEIAIGFSKGAKYIIMDEPFSGKDIFTRKDFLKLMAGTLHEDETIIISTHEIEDIQSFIDRALIMKGGKIIADLNMEELQSRGITLEQKFSELSGYDEEKFNELFLTIERDSDDDDGSGGMK
jgi:ABC-2 type transport system ATP-binding protein